MACIVAPHQHDNRETTRLGTTAVPDSGPYAQQMCVAAFCFDLGVVIERSRRYISAVYMIGLARVTSAPTSQLPLSKTAETAMVGLSMTDTGTGIGRKGKVD